MVFGTMIYQYKFHTHDFQVWKCFKFYNGQVYVLYVNEMVCWQNPHRWTWFYKDRIINKRLLWYFTVFAPPNLLCDSMSTIGIWVLRATPSWWEPPPETLIPRYWSELGAACYAFVVGATSRIPILLRHGSCVLRLSAGATSRIPSLVY